VQETRSLEPPAGSAIYTLDEGSGATAADSSANALHATLGAPTPGDGAEPAWVDGIVQGALRFDGANDYAEAGDAPALQLAGSFTLETWIRRQDTGKYGILLCRENSSARNYRLALQANGNLELQWKNTTGSTRLVASSAPVPAGSWHHVAAVFDQSAGESRLYIDGQPAGRGATTGSPQVGSVKLRLGARQSSSSFRDFYGGDLDLVRVAPQVLYRDAFTPPLRFTGRTVRLQSIRWSAAQAGSARIASYRVDRRLVPGNWESLATLAGDLQLTIEVPEGSGACYRVQAIDRLGLASPVSMERCGERPDPVPDLQIAEKATPAPSGLALRAGPNPFNPTTRISFHLDASTQVEGRVYDVAGRLVHVLVQGPLPAGEHRFEWQARDARGAPLPSGIYFLRLQAGRESRLAKLVLAK
jgi:hypothetical protein